MSASRSAAPFLIPVLLAVVVPCSRSQTPAEGFRSATDVTVVSFEVTVREASGAVAGLTKEDFVVTHDGVRVPLSNFGWYSRAAASRPPGETDMTPGEDDSQGAVTERDTYLCVFIDDDNMYPISRRRVREHVEAFVRTRVRASDRVMIATSNPDLTIVQDFTNDPEKIEKALQHIEKGKPGNRIGVDHERQNLAEMIQRFSKRTGHVPDASVGAVGSGSFAGGNPRLHLLQQVRLFARGERQRLLTSTRRMRVLLSRLAGMPGRRVMLYVSDGLPASPGIELFRAYEEYLSDPAARVVDAATLDGAGFIDELREVAVAAATEIHTLDARGLAVPYVDASLAFFSNVDEDALRNNQEPLTEIAHATGGRAVVGTNGFGAGLDRVAEGLDAYYLLGYVLPEEGRGRPHEIEVHVPTHPEAELLYRRSFLERGLPALVEDRVRAALTLGADAPQIAVTLEIGAPAKAAKGLVEIPVKIGLPIATVAALDEHGGLTADLVVLIVTQDAAGMQSSLHEIEAAVRVPAADVEPARGSTWPVTATLRVKPGTYSISAGVRDLHSNVTGVAVVTGVHARPR